MRSERLQEEEISPCIQREMTVFGTGRKEMGINCGEPGPRSEAYRRSDGRACLESSCGWTDDL